MGDLTGVRTKWRQTTRESKHRGDVDDRIGREGSSMLKDYFGER